MKPLYCLSTIIVIGIAASPWATGACGESSKPAPDAEPTPAFDAAIPDAGVPLQCVPVAGTDLKLQEVVNGLVEPLYLTAPAGDDRLFVIEQPGRIRIVEENALLPTSFLDITNIVRDTGNEQGLLGMVFHPNYANNGKFYVNYTATSPSGDTVIAEYTVSANVNVANTTGRILLTIEQPESNHNGGMLAFGGDGYLYIATGDGGGANDEHGQDGNGQNLDSLLGKMLRIDVEGVPYDIPSSNPFRSGGGLAEIWAYGLRNPWRFSFDSNTNDIYIADVGQGELEEVNVQGGDAAGGNYGWKIMEGTECFQSDSCDTTGLVQPVHQFPHTQGRQSITGGYVYRGVCLPDIAGRYFFGDYAGEQIYTFEYGGGAISNFQEITNSIDPNSDIAGLTSFGTDGFEELYIVSRDGKIFKIVAR
ncbi:MAG: PQQ-dependent sugar dehydrogenase [Myxococcales bacterium]|nr:PQQ-dependent sugar dehydrogenase [Myxococcales bacterium]